MDAIAKTSLLTAAMRAVETNRSDQEGRLFSDPYAETLAGKEGFEILAQAIAVSGDQPAIAIRTAFMDEKVDTALQAGVRQIVLFASGMDTRAYRLEFPEGTCVYELDRKEVLEYKEKKLTDVEPACDRKALAVDLREDWRKPLTDAGFKTGRPSLWIIEGLLMYLEKSQALELFTRINSLASPKDILLFDILSRTLLESAFMQNQLQFLKSMGAPWRFGEDEPEALMESFGWKASATMAGEYAPSRWPFPTAPRHVPNIPRGFFIEAIKLDRFKEKER